MYTREYFVERFRDTDTEDLLERMATADLTDEAKDAIRLILKERGISREQVTPLVQQAKKAVFRTTSPLKECDYCHKSVRLSRVDDEGQKFCSRACLRNARVMEAAVDIPERDIAELAAKIRNGACPACNGRESAIEVRDSYWVWSAVFYTRWGTDSKLCCRKCAVRSNLGSIASSLLLGWWGIPWGLFITPSQVISNIAAIFRRPDEGQPSEALIQAAKLQLALAALAQQRR